MNTFLPYPDFARSAAVLDRQRLGKQRVEVLALLRGKWRHHPAARMWRGHELSLARFGLAVCEEWRRRGYRDSVADKIREEIRLQGWGDTGLPPWFGDPAFHRAHRSYLKRRAPHYYGPRFPDVPDDLPVVWPAVKLTQA